MVTPPHEVPGDVSRTVNVAIHDKDDDKFYLLRGRQGQLVIYEIEKEVMVTALESKPLNVKELGELVLEDVFEATVEAPPLEMTITAPITGTHFDPEEIFNITYFSAGGVPARTCGVRISVNPIPDDAAYNAATVIQAEGGPDNGNIPIAAPVNPGTYYIRGRVTDSVAQIALSNQVTIIVDEPGPDIEPIWFTTNPGGGGG